MNEPFSKEQLATFTAPEPPEHFAARVLDSLPPQRNIHRGLMVAIASVAVVLWFFWGWMGPSHHKAVTLQPVKIQPKEETAPAAALILPTTTTAPSTMTSTATRESALTLYQQGRFIAASLEAKRIPELMLAKQIEDFELLYTSSKARFAANERAPLYESTKELLALDLSISSEGFYQEELIAMYAACTEAFALKLYTTSSAASTINYAALRMAYELAEEAQNLGAKKASSVLMSLKAEAQNQLKDADEAQRLGKPKEAQEHYNKVLQMMPAGTPEHTEANTKSKRLP